MEDLEALENKKLEKLLKEFCTDNNCVIFVEHDGEHFSMAAQGEGSMVLYGLSKALVESIKKCTKNESNRKKILKHTKKLLDLELKVGD